ncbi:MAG TPA: hypothetical protein VKB38_21285 [Terracidiphilus sp.]|nr:hypothetical protein [Terracidiphilus sp.]
MVIIIILGVLAVSALIGFAAWRFIKSTEDLQANPAKMRKRLLMLAVVYCSCMVMAIVEVLRGTRPPATLVGLPIGLFFVWWYLRAAAALKSKTK